MIADHFPVFIVKKKNRNDTRFTFILGRSYRNYDKDTFQEMTFSNIKCRSVWIKTNDPDNLWEIMLSIIMEAADLTCLYKTTRIRNNVPGRDG